MGPFYLVLVKLPALCRQTGPLVQQPPCQPPAGAKNRPSQGEILPVPSREKVPCPAPVISRHPAAFSQDKEGLSKAKEAPSVTKEIISVTKKIFSVIKETIFATKEMSSLIKESPA
jgi:hypothetical protein